MNVTHMATNTTDTDQNWTQSTNISSGTTLITTDQTFTYLMIKACLIPFILTSNMLIIGAVIFSQSLRKPIYVLVSSLAIGDFAVGAVVLPYDLVHGLVPGLKNLEMACIVKLWMWTSGLAVSITHLFVIALERLLAVRFPFLYRTSYTMSKCVLVAVCVWTLCFAMGSGALSLKNWNQEKGCVLRDMLTSPFGNFLTIYQVVLTLSTFTIYIYLFCVIRQSWKARAEMTSARLKAEHKQSILSFLVFILFVVFWVPAALNGVVSRLLRITDRSLARPLAIFASSNSFVNFIVYGLKNDEMRMALKKMFQCRQTQAEAEGAHLSHIPAVSHSSTSVGKTASTTSTSVSMVTLDAGNVQEVE
ncbi:lysophosphatidic acid receptor 3-like [Haliotis asinina]|uniref:lysophosphatidic acid receptor 3-like n=1 Tax=Haliotis asinina TaxID=109174 RepID=UPI003531D76B